MGINGPEGINTNKSSFLRRITKTVENNVAEVVQMVKPETPKEVTTREKLDQLTNVSPTEISTAEDVRAVNDCLATLGYNFKVSPKQILSVRNAMTANIQPALGKACDNAVAARIENPEGPFADLFAIA